MKKVKIGNCVFGGEKIYIQSMLNVPADDVENSVKQAVRLFAPQFRGLKTRRLLKR